MEDKDNGWEALVSLDISHFKHLINLILTYQISSNSNLGFFLLCVFAKQKKIDSENGYNWLSIRRLRRRKKNHGHNMYGNKEVG